MTLAAGFTLLVVGVTVFFIARDTVSPDVVLGAALVVLMIGLALIKVGIQYAAGGVPAIGKPEYGSLLNWTVALSVVVVTLGLYGIFW